MNGDYPFKEAVRVAIESEGYDEGYSVEGFDELSTRDKAMLEAGAFAALRVIPSFPTPSTPPTFRIRHADDENNPCAGVVYGVLDENDDLVLDCQNCSTTVKLNV